MTLSETLVDTLFHDKIKSQYSKFILEGIALAATLAWSNVIQEGVTTVMPKTSPFMTNLINAIVLTIVGAWLVNYIQKSRVLSKKRL